MNQYACSTEERFLKNSEVNISDLLENLNEMFHGYHEKWASQEKMTPNI